MLISTCGQDLGKVSLTFETGQRQETTTALKEQQPFHWSANIAPEALDVPLLRSGSDSSFVFWAS